MVLTELEIKKAKSETKPYKLTDGGGLLANTRCWRRSAQAAMAGSLGLLGSLIEEDRLPERRAKRARCRPRRQ